MLPNRLEKMTLPCICLRSWLDERATRLTLSQWEPELVFEVKARRLKLLRMKSAKTESDRVRLQPDMEHLLAGLIAIDAARAAVLCNPGSS
ncbi:TPA: hypothetical protein OKT35_005106 [Escherichia coli]|nr:hypothetical protein [Escherichia coli]